MRHLTRFFITGSILSPTSLIVGLKRFVGLKLAEAQQTLPDNFIIAALIFLLSIAVLAIAFLFYNRARRRPSHNEQILRETQDGLEKRVQERTAELEAAQERQRYLADTSQILLSSTLDYEATLRRMAAVIVPRLADWCVVETIDIELSRRQMAAAHLEAGKEQVVYEMCQRFRLDIILSQDHSTALHNKESILQSEVPDEFLASLSLDPDQLRMLRELGLRSLMIVPILALDRLLGTIALVRSVSGRRYTPADLALAEELANRAAFAVENARLYEEARQARQSAEQNAARLARYQLVLSALSETITLDQVAGVIVNKGGGSLGAVAGSIALLTDNGTILELVSTAGYAQDAIDNWQRFPITTAGPLADAVRNRTPVWLSSPDEARGRYPNFRWDTPDHVAWATLPLLISGRIIGGLTLSFDNSQHQTEVDHAFLMGMAQKCAQALDRILLYSEVVDQREQFRVTLASIGDAVIATNAQGRVIFMNGVAQTLTGWTGDSGIGYFLREVFTIVNETTREAAESPFTKVMREGDIVGLANHTLLITKDQKEVPIDDSGAPIRDEHGAIKGVVLVFRDITERRRQEAALEASLQRAQRARQEAEQASQLRLKFLAMISHELRTPLASIKGFASTLLATDVTWDAQEQREFITIINEEANKLTDLIEQLLDLSRIQAGQLRIQPEPGSLDQIIATALPQLNVIAAQHQLRIDNYLHLPQVWADAQRVAQVLVNLVGNAAKYAPPGSAITIAFANHDPVIQISVTDQGPGIPARAREKVFEAFSQLEADEKQKGKGAGLGLVICKGLIEAHGGKIWIDGRPDSGTTIAFTLPLARTTAPDVG